MRPLVFLSLMAVVMSSFDLPALARGGGGRSGGGGRAGGGGARVAPRSSGGTRTMPHAGASRSSAGRVTQGLNSPMNSSLGRGNQRPAGGWQTNYRPTAAAGASRLPSNLGTRPATGRPAQLPSTANRNLSGNRLGTNVNINNRPVNIDRNTTINRNTAVNRTVANTAWRGPINYARPAWATTGWAAARPWNTGWYAGPARWGWYSTNAAAWGIAGLATGAIVGGLVNNAITNDTNYIVVPSTSYQLAFGTVQPVSGQTIRFQYADSGRALTVIADCQNGLFNGRPPATANEAQLLNAACQVAFGQF
jgi:hypothetical protein